MTIRTIILAVAFLIPISAEAQESADCVAVHDSNGTRVARAATTVGQTSVFFSHQGRVSQFYVLMDALVGATVLHFTGPGCTGEPYMVWTDSVSPIAHLLGTDAWYPDTTATPAPLETASYRSVSLGLCVTASQSLPSAVPAFNFTMPTFTPPFHLEPEPCFTPDEPTPEQFIHGCIKTNGTIKVVGDPADCSDRETPISWLGE